MAKVIELRANLGADVGKFTRPIEKAQKTFKDFAADLRDKAVEAGQAMADLSKKVSVATGAMGASLAGALGGAAVLAGDFDKAFAEVLTLMAKMGEPLDPVAIRQMKNEVMDLAEATGLDATKAVDSLYNAISAGIAPAKALEFLQASATGAIAGVTDLSAAVNVGSNLLNVYGMEASELEGVMDTLFTAVRLGKTTMGELSNSLGRVASLAEGAGLDIKEMSSMFVVATKKGIETNEAVTALKAAIAGIQKPTSDAAAMAKKLGVEFNIAAFKSKGVERFFIDILKGAAENGVAADEAFAALFGSVEAANFITGVMGQNGEMLVDTLKQMGDNANAVALANQTIVENDPTMIYRQMTQALRNLGIVIGQEVLALVRPFTQEIFETARAVREYLSENPALVQALVAVAAGAAVVLLAVSGLAAGVALLGVTLAGIALAATPITAVMGAILLPLFLAFGAAVAFVLANWEQLAAWGEENWPAIKETVQGVLGPITDSLRITAKVIKAEVIGAGAGLVDWLNGALPTVLSLIEKAGAFVAQVAIPTVGKAVRWLFKRMKALGEWLRENWPTIRDMVVSGYTAWWDAVSLVVDILGLFLGKIWELIGVIDRFDKEEGDLFTDAFTKIAEKITSANEAISKMVRWLQDLARELQIVIDKYMVFEEAYEQTRKDIFEGVKDFWNLVFPGFIVEDPSASIPAFANGGVVTSATMGMIGEAGPEAVIPLRNGAVPVQVTGGGGGGQVFNITQLPGEDGESLARRIAGMIIDRRGMAF